MEIVFPAAILSEFAHAVAFLGKVGDELYWEIWPDKLVLSAINSSRSALAKCTFHAPFFRRFAVRPPASGADEPVLECRVLNKVVQLLFKRRPGSVAHEVEEVQLRHLVDENRLAFLFVCKHGITRTHKLTYEDCVAHDADIDDDRLQNEVVLKPEAIAHALGNLHSSLDELAWSVTGAALAINSYVASEAVEERRVLHTRLRMPAEEFDVYNVGGSTYLIFALKEFKAMLAFAEAVKSTITVRFDDGGTPIVFRLSLADVLETRLTVSTRGRPPAAGGAEPPSTAAAAGATPNATEADGTDGGSGDYQPQRDGSAGDAASDVLEGQQQQRGRRPGDLQFPFRSSPATLDGPAGGSEPHLMPAVERGTPADRSHTDSHTGSPPSDAASAPSAKRARP